MKRILFGLCFGGLFAACSAAAPSAPTPGPEEETGVPETQELGQSDTFTYYIVTHADFRKCMYPICGGYFVKRVNRQLTHCADGKWRTECHMLALDTSALGLSADEAAKFENEVFGAGHGLVRGTLTTVGNAETLVASEAWAGAAMSEPTGIFYRVTDNGIVCITTPCLSLTEAKLNDNVKRNIAGVDLSTSGANDKQIQAGYEQIAGKGALVAGNHKKIYGPGGSGWNLLASEFYMPVVPAPKYCATVYLEPPVTLSPTFYAKNFTSEADAKDWLSASFPTGQNSDIRQGACDEPRPCMEIYKPVCGTVADNAAETYANSCFFEGAVMGGAGADGESKGFYTDGACDSAQ